MKKTMFLLMMVVAVLASTASANLLTNGDFSDGATGWTVVSNWAGPITNGWTYGPVADTHGYVYTDGGPAIEASWTQVLTPTATASGSYQLTLNTVTFPHGNTDTLEIYLQETTGGSQLGGVQYVTVAMGASNGDKTPHIVNFNWSEETDIGAPLALVLRNKSTAGATNGYALFDDLVLTPEPATLVLLGLGGLVLRRRKRFCKRQ